MLLVASFSSLCRIIFYALDRVHGFRREFSLEDTSYVSRPPIHRRSEPRVDILTSWSLQRALEFSTRTSASQSMRGEPAHSSFTHSLRSNRTAMQSMNVYRCEPQLPAHPDPRTFSSLITYPIAAMGLIPDSLGRPARSHAPYQPLDCPELVGLAQFLAWRSYTLTLARHIPG